MTSPHKIDIYSNINDVPIPPTSTTPGNVSHIIAKHNALAESIVSLTTPKIVKGITTNTNSTILYLDDANTPIILTNNTTWLFTVDIVARRTDIVGSLAGFTLQGIINRDATAASTALVGTVTKETFNPTITWDVNATADIVNGALQINVTGEAAKTISWVAMIKAVEVIQ